MLRATLASLGRPGPGRCLRAARRDPDRHRQRADAGAARRRRRRSAAPWLSPCGSGGGCGCLLAAALLLSIALRPLVPAAGDGVAYGVCRRCWPPTPARAASRAVRCWPAARSWRPRRSRSGSSTAASFSGLVFYGILFATPWIIGRALRFSGQRQGLLEDRARLLGASSATRARVAVAEERARIARELHDVVAHSVSSVMVLQAARARAAALRPGDARERAGRDRHDRRARRSPRCAACSACSPRRGRRSRRRSRGSTTSTALVEQVRAAGPAGRAA